jgi:phage/plasmid-like protein (TIGR03299 family)
MSHLIYEFDNVLTVGDRPWHGLGINLPGGSDVSPSEAMRITGLGWEVGKEPIYLADGTVVPDRFAVVRKDRGLPLGIVGSEYSVFQNAELFGFMGGFCDVAGTSIETCGSLRDGRTIWAMSRSGETEYVKGDPVEKYFMIKNSHDGSSSLEIAFTDVRVVCNNTLSAALRGARNKVSVIHTSNMAANVRAAGDVLAHYVSYQRSLGEAMSLLAAASLTEGEMRDVACALAHPRGKAAAAGGDPDE